MSALVYGKSSSLFQEFPTTSSFSRKRLHCSTSPIHPSPFATASSGSASLDRLQIIFPAIEIKVLQKALEESGDLGSAIMSLIQLCLGSSVDVNDDQNWLFEKEPKKKSKKVSDSDDVVSTCSGKGSTWPPRACYLPEADVYALPYTVPF